VLRMLPRSKPKWIPSRRLKQADDVVVAGSAAVEVAEVVRRLRRRSRARATR
jgi:hypothetical protein